MNKIPVPKVSIIMPNLNGQNYLKACLDSLLKQTYKDYEIIVIDNGSKDNSLEILKKNYSKVRIIENKKNEGFAKANNQGIEASEGEYIATLNNDTVVDKDWLKNLVLAIEGSEHIGMCASKILSATNPSLIDSVGVKVCLDGMSRGAGRLETDSGQYNAICEILLPSACAALYKKKMLNETGLFDEDFFAYCEDTDLGLRAILMGWKALLNPKAIVYHYYSSTGGKYSSFKAYLVERNHLWLALKIFPLKLVLLSPIFIFYRFALQFYAALIRKGATSEFLSQYSFLDTAIIIFKAYLDALKKMPLFIKKRRIIQKNKKISKSEFYSLLKKHKLTFKEIVFKK